MKKNNTAKRVSSTTRANGLYSLELRKIGPKFSISQDKKKQRDKNQCRQKGSKNKPFYFFSKYKSYFLWDFAVEYLLF